MTPSLPVAVQGIHASGSLIGRLWLAGRLARPRAREAETPR
uniref:Uncharacterized protein n=1 Tax=Myoviridae sp. ctuIn11 TaxID=2827715 RepID=A0A8S5SHG7_9CAUD|nr:MAG TPA: hypothetical protein [Myoviridae sp. ctuIn11]